MKKFCDKEAQETQHFVNTMAANNQDGDKLRELASNLPQVSFDPMVKILGEAGTPQWQGLAAKTSSARKLAWPTPILFFGLVLEAGGRWWTNDAQTANDAFEHDGSRIQGIFHTCARVNAWANTPEDPRDSSSSSDNEPQVPKAGSDAHHS